MPLKKISASLPKSVVFNPVHLPPELMREILRYLHRSPSPFALDLLSSSLVCQSWHDAARSLLSLRFLHLLSFDVSVDSETCFLANLIVESKRVGIHYADQVECIDIDLGAVCRK